MSNTALTKTRPLKRSGSDSGISNDSMDIKVNEIAKPLKEKPKIFKISISTCGNSKRAVNGKELVLPQEEPGSDEEFLSSEEEGEIIDSSSDTSSVSADNEAQAKSEVDESSENDNDQKGEDEGHNVTENILRDDLNVSDNSDHEDWGCQTYWERDVIDVQIISSKDDAFSHAVLLPKSSINMELGVPYNHFPKPLPRVTAMDDDVISLHPDDLNFDSNKNLLPGRAVVFKQPCTKRARVSAPESPAPHLPLAKTEPPTETEETLPNNDNLKTKPTQDAQPQSVNSKIFLQRPAQSTRPTTAGTSALKRPNSDSSLCDTFVPNKRPFASSKSPVPVPHVKTSSSPPELKVPSLFDLKIPPPPFIASFPKTNPPPPIFQPLPIINPPQSRFEPLSIINPPQPRFDLPLTNNPPPPRFDLPPINNPPQPRFEPLPIINPPEPRFEPPLTNNPSQPRIEPPLIINLPPCEPPPIINPRPPPKQLPVPLSELCYKICWHYDLCNLHYCKKIHRLTPDHFYGPAKVQLIAWRAMKTRFCPKRPHIIRDILKCVPGVLTETKHEELLMLILHDLMDFENVYSRDRVVREIVFALLEIRSDGGKNNTVSFGTIIDDIFTTSHCYEPHTQRQSSMCDFILNLTTEQDDFMQYWPIIEKLFPFVVVTFSRPIVDKIVDACCTQQVSSNVKKSVMHMLLDPKVVTQCEQTLTFVRTILSLPEADDTVSQPGSSAPSESLAPCEDESTHIEEPLDREFMECETADQLGAFLRRNSAERCWKPMVLIFDKHLHEINIADVPTFLDMFKDVIIDSMLDEIDEKHQTLLMALVVAVLIFLRENPVMDNSKYKIGASLIAHFESYLSKFHEVPVYHEKYKDNMQLLILSRLIHGCKFKLALRWMQTSKFAIPQMSDAQSPGQSSKDFQWFYRIMKQLFDGLYQSKSLDDCKDLIVLLHDNRFDEDAQRAMEKTENNTNPWCMMDYYKAYVKEKIDQWQNNNRNILEDESIFRFYKHLHLQEVRNVAILLYLKKPTGVAFTTLCAMIENFPEFYKCEGDYITYNENHSVVEIQLLTHVFFYKLYRRNRAPYAVHAEYEELKSAKACPPKVLTASVWDTETAIRRRVNFALKDFAPLPIKRFDGTFKVGDVKLILEQIRRRNAA